LEIEQIRGVKTDRTINNLLEKGIIKEVGKKDALGKPMLYGTTHEFLKIFGMSSLNELPRIEESDGRTPLLVPDVDAAYRRRFAAGRRQLRKTADASRDQGEPVFGRGDESGKLLR
jgi:hypothetical protein